MPIAVWIPRLLLPFVALPLVALAEAEVCRGPSDSYVAVPGFGEAAPLPTADALALSRREGRELILAGDREDIRLADPAECELGDQQPGFVLCIRHRLVAAFEAPRGYLVERGHYEHVDFLWIDRGSGHAESIADLPRLSPGHRWLLSVSASEYMAFNGIEVLDLAQGGVARVWMHAPRRPETYGFFTFWRWTGPESAILCAYREAGPDLLDRVGPEPVLLRRGAFGWALEALR